MIIRNFLRDMLVCMNVLMQPVCQYVQSKVNLLTIFSYIVSHISQMRKLLLASVGVLVELCVNI